MDLDTLIEILSIQLNHTTAQRQNQLQKLENQIDLSQTKFFEALSPFDDILVDLQGLSSEEQQYLNYLENRQQSGQNLQDIIPNSKKNVNLSGTARYLSNTKLDEILCQICNDGDQHQDNPIILCSSCNIQVHQKCYGIPTLPQDDWICQLCYYYGPSGKYLKCPLCTKRGGAMQQTDLLMNNSIFEHINPTYHAYALTHYIQQQCKIYLKNLLIDPFQSNDSLSNSNQPLYQQNLSYDFQLIQNNNLSEAQELQSQYIWAHISCAYWIPECSTTTHDHNPSSQILNISNIDKKRFNLLCHVCKSKKQGASIQCSKGKCCTAFHVECARRAQFFMELKPPDQGIYCEKHMPLKLKRILENRAKGFVEEIQLFCKSIDKMLKYKQNSGNNANSNAQSEKKKRLALRAEQQEIESEIKEENKKILNKLNKFIQEQNLNKLVIDLTKVKNGFEVQGIQLPLQGQIDMMQISSSDPIWDKFEYGEYTKDQTYRLYKRAVRMEKKTRTIKQRKVVDLYEEEMNIRRRVGLMKKLKMRQKQDYQRLHNQQQQQQQQSQSIMKIKIPKNQIMKKEMLYCICRQPFSQEDDMMQCEKCLEWYHLKCIGFSQDVEKAKEINYICENCLQSLNREKMRKIKTVYKEYFRDSVDKSKIHHTRQHQKVNYKSLSKEKQKQSQERRRTRNNPSQKNRFDTTLKLRQKDNQIFISSQQNTIQLHNPNINIGTREKIKRYR